MGINSWRRTRCSLQSQQHRTMVHDTHSCSQHCNGWVLSWCLSEDSNSSGDWRAVGSRFQVMEAYAAKLRWPVDVQVQATGGPWRVIGTGDKRRVYINMTHRGQHGFLEKVGRVMCTRVVKATRKVVVVVVTLIAHCYINITKRTWRGCGKDCQARKLRMLQIVVDGGS